MKTSAYIYCTKLPCIITGYVSRNKSRTTCDDSAWSPPLSSMVCVEGVALIVGGASSGDGDRKVVEIYGPDLHDRLPDLPDQREVHTVDYVDGQVLLCGGRVSGTYDSCLQLQIEGMAAIEDTYVALIIFYK